ncbi:extracellular solute-binding protein [Mesorhizobium sp. M1C.F.Ca.ET.193.01.1.1]|uniref:extracellular solute-binding protein n=1 Tax=unclassified Mesorhizobium TaxID=325217 RepID=UPI000FD31832|nr:MULTISPECIES: extracellular solute-binding protein [unclassified Mesorhizobium]TGS98897.1 extracellular solute-binding protein [bacterium M00.F.Ca.ET.177.01.1.1]TGQ52924.1 extracellular solute-binding protein [Mesorhizobium sp. M1C.F.Ca.ET.210.01.1.1]TGQ70210.1 extracellular solute-binding protein [Mesorhizobium sp. M1C.F.Ca.ET.212.01.1.1]TGR06008.1 extracellular solute-binding protein [Mesorhizobium sp. M1C.F.Ca.ET.204.01.1.1]TGR26747.1 extracellular solute-binding protein [Mesorhizobium s
MTSLKGMTWSHPRGYDPMVACSKLWKEKTGVSIEWEKRSLQDFESFPVEELARAYDLIVIDHPHVGQITAEKCLAPLDVPGREAEREALAKASVGRSYPSYAWQGRQWAFPIDAATQVQAWRPDLIGAPPTIWTEVLGLAEQGRVLLPLKPPHSLMCFYTLAADLGRPCAVDGQSDLVDPDTGETTFEILREIAALVDPQCLTMDPIAVFEKMAGAGSRIACAPLIYGYVPYAKDGFRPNRLAFCDMPSVGGSGPVGSALGGTGIAVSAFSAASKEAIDFAYWIASGEVQRGPYAAAGGQPGHAAAWEDEAVNAATGDFYRGTRATLEGAWVRPRHDGYMPFQQAASDRLNEGLAGRQDARRVVADINRLFRKSFAPAVAG